MHWNSVGEFFAMGGYALYVWGSFGACAVLMVAEPFLAQATSERGSRNLARERLADELDHQQGISR
jgi:heme exporter protein D